MPVHRREDGYGPRHAHPERPDLAGYGAVTVPPC